MEIKRIAGRTRDRDELPSTGAAAMPVEPELQKPNFWQGTAASVTRPASRIEETLEGGLGTIAELAQSGANKVVSTLGGPEQAFGKDIEDIASGLPTIQKVRERNTKFIEPFLGKGSNDAQTVPEEVIDAVFGAAVPYLLTGGTGAVADVVPFVGRVASGSLASQGVRAAGGGQVAQVIGDFLGSYGFDLARQGAIPGAFGKQIKEIMDVNYDKARQSAAKIGAVDGTELEKKIHDRLLKVEERKAGLNRTDAKEYADQLRAADREIKAGKIRVQDIWDRKQEINAQRGQTNNPKLAAKYDNLVGDYLKELEKVGKEHPDFGQSFNRAENLYKASEVRSAVGRLFDKATNLEPILKNQLAKGTFGRMFGTLSTAPLTFTGRYFQRSMELLLKNPEAGKVLFEMGQAALKDNLQQFKLGLVKFNHLAEKVDKQENKKDETIAQKDKRLGIKRISGSSTKYT